MNHRHRLKLELAGIHVFMVSMNNAVCSKVSQLIWQPFSRLYMEIWLQVIIQSGVTTAATQVISPKHTLILHETPKVFKRGSVQHLGYNSSDHQTCLCNAPVSQFTRASGNVCVNLNDQYNHLYLAARDRQDLTGVPIVTQGSISHTSTEQMSPNTNSTATSELNNWGNKTTHSCSARPRRSQHFLVSQTKYIDLQRYMVKKQRKQKQIETWVWKCHTTIKW